NNFIFVPQKTGATGGFAVNAFNGATGQKVWTLTTDYILPAHNWTPPMGITLIPGQGELAIPAAGGTVLRRDTVTSASGKVTRLAFFGISNYNQNPAAFNSAIHICTPLTSDNSGNLYFGYVSSGIALPGYP